MEPCPPKRTNRINHVSRWSSQRGRIYTKPIRGRKLMCVGNLFGGGGPQFTPPPPPKPMAPAPTVKGAAPPPEMVTPEKIKQGEEEEKISTRKKKALEIQKVKEGVKTFSAIDPSTMPQSPEGGIPKPN